MAWSNDYLSLCSSSGRSQHCPRVALYSYSCYFLVCMEKITGKSIVFPLDICYSVYNMCILQNISAFHLSLRFLMFIYTVVAFPLGFSGLDGILKIRQLIINLPQLASLPG